jgi:hypothetical protein
LHPNSDKSKVTDELEAQVVRIYPAHIPELSNRSGEPFQRGQVTGFFAFHGHRHWKQ